MTDAAHSTGGGSTAGGGNPAPPPVPPHPAGAAGPGGGPGTGHPEVTPPAGAAHPADRAGSGAGPVPTPPAGAPAPYGQPSPYGSAGPAGHEAPGAGGPHPPHGPHGGDGDFDPPRPKRKRRGRGLLITLVVLIGLFVAADRLAVNWLENKAADEIKSREGLAIDPEVSIKGFPFLTQVLDKELEEIEINLDGLVTDAGQGRPVRVTELRAVLHQVKISGDLSGATAERASGRAHISYEDLSAAAGPGIKVSQAPKNAEGKSQVKITGNFMGLSMSANGTVSLVDGNTIRVRVNSIPPAIPGRLEQEVRSRTDFDRTVDGMPSGLRLEGVETTPEGLDISVGGSQVDLAN